MTTATRHGDLQQPGRAQPTAKSRIGLIVALSMAAGLIVAVVLVAMPFIPARENVLTGVVLLAFALGWALLAVLSTRFSDQPQRWAAVPATAHQVHRTIRTALGEAVRRRQVQENVATLAKAPKIEAKEPEPYSVAEIRSILTAARERRNAARWAIALSLGLRQVSFAD